jgi:DNA-binding CsgD family transcriptional regulator
MHAHRYHPTFFVALALTDADLFDKAEDVLRQGRRLADELGTAWAPPLYHCVDATRLLKMGNLADAAAEASAALGFIEEFHVSVGAVWPHALLAHTALLTGDMLAVEAALGRGEVEIAERGLQFGSDLLILTRAQVLEACGDPETAAGLLDAVWTQAFEVGLANVLRALGPTLARLLVGTGQPERAAAVGLGLQQVAARSDVPSVHGAALQCQGLAAADPQLLLAAVEKWRNSHRPLDLAWACSDAAEALRPADQRETAAALLHEAYSLAMASGAVWLAGRFAQQLPTRGRRRRPARPKTGWDSLTASEWQVVRLLAQGLSNGQIAERLFLSRRTVESHLYRVFTKLDVGSRAELAVKAVTQAAAPS